MRRFYRSYIFSVSGALGGLVASLFHQYLLLDAIRSEMAPMAHYIYLTLLGAMVGISIGFFPSFILGRSNYSLRGAAWVGAVGALYGGVGGALALPAAEYINQYLEGGFKGRMVALALFGLALGVAEGIIGGSRRWRALAGGVIGGLLAGGVLEMLVYAPGTKSYSGIVALISIGLAIALSISLFVNVLVDAWLEGDPKSKFRGPYYLDKFRQPNEAVLGSGGAGKVYVYIPDAQPAHASITLTDTGALLRHISDKGQTYVSESPIREVILHDGDVIQVGGAKLKYRERRKAALHSYLPLHIKSRG
jgi:hypothetical protein